MRWQSTQHSTCSKEQAISNAPWWDPIATNKVPGAAARFSCWTIRLSASCEPIKPTSLVGVISNGENFARLSNCVTRNIVIEHTFSTTSEIDIMLVSAERAGTVDRANRLLLTSILLKARRRYL